VLRAAGIEPAAALVATEDDDIGNLHAALVAHELNPALRIRLRRFNQELGERVESLFQSCAVLDPAALAAPAFVSAALHDDWEQRIEVGGSSLVVRHSSASDPDVVLALARILPDGTAEPFPEGEDVLCLTHSSAVPQSAATLVVSPGYARGAGGVWPRCGAASPGSTPGCATRSRWCSF
jgi:hypothetical protein